MMLPTYPVTCFEMAASEPETTVVQRRGASGRIRTYDVGTYSDHLVTLTHTMIRQSEIDEVMEFWRANRGQHFLVQDPMGEDWVGVFVRKPTRQHIDGHWYNLVAQLVRYEFEEGGIWR